MDKNLQQVSRITSTSVFATDAAENGKEAFEYGLDKIVAVDLTDEVLEECGFVFHHYFKFWQLITTGVRSDMDIDKDYHVIDFMRRPIAKKLASLHQLQNVYFILKGRELKFNRKVMLAV